MTYTFLETRLFGKYETFWGTQLRSQTCFSIQNVTICTQKVGIAFLQSASLQFRLTLVLSISWFHLHEHSSESVSLWASILWITNGNNKKWKRFILSIEKSMIVANVLCLVFLFFSYYPVPFWTVSTWSCYATPKGLKYIPL